MEHADSQLMLITLKTASRANKLSDLMFIRVIAFPTIIAVSYESSVMGARDQGSGQQCTGTPSSTCEGTVRGEGE